MGTGRWTDFNTRAVYSAYTDSIKDTKHYTEVFTRRSINKALDPSGIKLRESCDSDANPNSNAIIVGLDVTGSMGMIAHEIAKNGLGRLFDGILDRQPVTDPHIMFMGIGDVQFDASPLQASQFEADARIIQQLNDLHVEGGGGGNTCESYDLPWYFAATRTSLDCFTKRNRKGYLFTVGDENPPSGLSKEHIRQVFGSSDQTGYTGDELLKMAEEKYHVFHVIVEEGSFARRQLQSVSSNWQQILGKRALCLSNYKHLPEVIISAMDVSEGKDPVEVADSWQDPAVKKTIHHAFQLD